MAIRLIAFEGRGFVHEIHDDEGTLVASLLAGDDESWKLTRLLAAAPELLDACKAALRWHECETESDHCWSMIRSAIAKAEE